MLDYCKKIIDLTPLQGKFKAFRWGVKTVNGHDIKKLFFALKALKEQKSDRPQVLIANTIKGKGVPRLEKDYLCHVKSLKEEEVVKILENYEEL